MDPAKRDEIDDQIAQLNKLSASFEEIEGSAILDFMSQAVADAFRKHLVVKDVMDCEELQAVVTDLMRLDIPGGDDEELGTGLAKELEVEHDGVEFFLSILVSFLGYRINVIDAEASHKVRKMLDMNFDEDQTEMSKAEYEYFFPLFSKTLARIELIAMKLFEGGDFGQQVEWTVSPAKSAKSPAKANVNSSCNNAGSDIFISLRYEEAEDKAMQLKRALQAHGVSVYINNSEAGKNLMDEIAENIQNCKLPVLMVTETYGKATTAFSTSQELDFILTLKGEENKDFFPIKMCEKWKIPKTRMALANVKWEPWTEDSPDDLVDKILKVLQKKG
jgi:hypothetical protein